MKPINLFALLLFLTGLVWVLTLSENTVRQVQKAYYGSISPFLRGGSAVGSRAESFLEEVENSKDLENQ